MLEFLINMFPGIGTLFIVSPKIAIARIVLIVFGGFLAYWGFNRKLEPLIMIPMGFGMIAVNAAMMILPSGAVGNIMLDPLVSDTDLLMNAFQVNFLQPIYNLLFSNGLIACLVFMGIGARCEISFFLSKPWPSIIIGILAEMGTFAALFVGVSIFGLDVKIAAAIATIGGADGPMVLIGSLMMAPELFVPIAIIAYLYLSLTYGIYPFIIKLLVPKQYRGLDTYFDVPEISSKTKFVFIIASCAFLCLLLPSAAPLFVSFFVGMAVKEAEVDHYVELIEKTVSYLATFFLGFVLGVLCEASTILDSTVLIILCLGIIALVISACGGLLGGWILYCFYKKKGIDFNPVIGIAGVSCVPTTAKLAQHAAQDENPFAIILPVAMGANISGVIVSAIATGILISTIQFVT